MLIDERSIRIELDSEVDDDLARAIARHLDERLEALAGSIADDLRSVFGLAAARVRID